MSTVNKYMVYGPVNTLRRLPEKLFEQFEPKYLYKYEASESGDQIYVAVFEQYEKQINATSTLTCVMECTNTYSRVEMKKSGGRMGFRGSSLSEERSIDAGVIDFIMDNGTRSGLSLPEDRRKDPEESED